MRALHCSRFPSHFREGIGDVTKVGEFLLPSSPPRSGAGQERALLSHGSQDTTAPLPAGTSQRDGSLTSHFGEQFRWYLWSSLGSQQIAPGSLSPSLGYRVPGDCSWDCPADPSQKKLVRNEIGFNNEQVGKRAPGQYFGCPKGNDARWMVIGLTGRIQVGFSRALWKLTNTGFIPEAFTSSALGGWSWRRQLPIP